MPVAIGKSLAARMRKPVNRTRFIYWRDDRRAGIQWRRAQNCFQRHAAAQRNPGNQVHLLVVFAGCDFHGIAGVGRGHGGCDRG